MARKQGFCSDQTDMRLILPKEANRITATSHRWTNVTGPQRSADGLFETIQPSSVLKQTKCGERRQRLLCL